MLTILANRLPVERTPDGWVQPAGGLVSALRPVLEERGGAWVGWAGDGDTDALPDEIDGLTMYPVPLSPEEIDEYYTGFANETLWPLYHDNVRPPSFHRHWWRTYADVNRRFATRAADVAPRGSAVWVHDYHLSLVPRMLRDLRPDLAVGFFLHIPFPPMELFAQLPWRAEIILGMLGADALGFQTRYGARNFRQVARRWGGATGRGRTLVADGRRVLVEAHPIAIDSAAYAERAERPPVRALAAELRERLAGRRIFLGVDRLDYTKGIGIRLRAFETLLDEHPELAEEIVFVQVAVPSREHVAGYKQMREEIERLAGHINGRYSRLGMQPVQYRYGAVSPEDLTALYVAADAMIVTPLRDGMNLVAKEYVASRTKEDGYLVLSEFAGAAHELGQADLVNPYDLDGTAEALYRAVTTSAEDRRRRMLALRRQVMRHDVQRWARRAVGAFAPPSPDAAEIDGASE